MAANRKFTGFVYVGDGRRFRSFDAAMRYARNQKRRSGGEYGPHDVNQYEGGVHTHTYYL